MRIVPDVFSWTEAFSKLNKTLSQLAIGVQKMYNELFCSILFTLKCILELYSQLYFVFLLGCILQLHIPSCIKPFLFSPSWWVVDAVAKVELRAFCEGTCSFCKRVQFDQRLEILCNPQQIHKKSKNLTTWSFFNPREYFIILNYELHNPHSIFFVDLILHPNMSPLNLSGNSIFGLNIPPFCFLQVKYSWERKME